MIDFEDYPINSHVQINGNEYASLGVTFNSPLDDPLGKLYVESGSYYSSLDYGSNFLSVDREPFASGNDGNEDDMIFNITSTAYAFGVMIVVDNSGGSGESVTVSGSSGDLYFLNNIPNFFGIIGDEPITRVSFDEGVWDGDDIGYDGIVMGNVSTSIPDASVILLLGSSLMSLVGFGRKKVKK